MRYITYQTQLESVAISAPRFSPSLDVTLAGGDSVAFVVVATSASSPNTASIQLQGSADNTNFVNIGSAVTVAANGVYTVGQDRPLLRYYRVAYAIASGSYTSALTVIVKGDR